LHRDWRNAARRRLAQRRYKPSARAQTLIIEI
jgi:hypothetical protein